jgi:hypothetical protein
MKASIFLLLLVGCTRDQGSACGTPAHQPDAGTVAPLLSCGDGTCQVGETLDNCSRDCFVCGDGTCSEPESITTCPGDCSLCGDGMCTGGETATTCDDDCTVCGDLACTGGETAMSCAQDCAAGLKVVNSASYTFYYLYLWSCAGTNDYVNRLAGSLPNGYSIELTNLEPGCFNFQVATSGNTQMMTSQHTLVAGETYVWTLTN